MIIFLANQFIGDKLSTGGDLVALNVAKRCKGRRFVLAPLSVHKTLKKFVSGVELISTDNRSAKTASTVIGGVVTIWRYFVRAWNSYKWLLKNVKSGDVIYLTGDFICNSLPVWLLGRKILNTKVVANFYHRNPTPSSRTGNPYLVSLGSRWLQSISLQIIKSMVSKVFVLTEEGKRELLKAGFGQDVIVISGAGSETGFANEFRNIKKKKNQIVFIGRINVTKGAFDLINILEKVKQKNSNFVCKIIGQGSEEDMGKLKSLIKKNNLKDQVDVLGYVSEKRKYEVLSGSGVLVLPSKEEGFGIVVLEALACGVPVICYDLPALRVLFGQYSQVEFVPLGNSEKFFKAIVKNLERSEFTKFTIKFPSWDDVYKIQSKYI